MSVLTLQDKYVLLQAEFARLKRRLNTANENTHYWREKALFFQAERDVFREQLLELGQAGEEEL